MDISQVKLKLLENPDLLICLLEKLGCEKISDKYLDQIRCSLPNGDNPTSIRIKLNENLTCAVFSRSDFEGGDIFSLIQYIKKISFNKSLIWVSKILNVDNIHYIMQNKNGVYSFLKNFKLKDKKNIVPHKIFDENILNKYDNKICQEWLNEGISKKTQNKYNVLYDNKANRIIYPIRNYNGDIINIKGRTCDAEYKEKGIRKYTYYYTVGNFDILFGLNFNYHDIISSKELIIVEAEKSVMKFDSVGIHNVIAVCTHSLYIYQIKKILSLKCKNIILAFDNDVTKEENNKTINQLRKFVNVYIIKDQFHLLDEKDSPIDKGVNVWNKLYAEKILIN